MVPSPSRRGLARAGFLIGAGRIGAFAWLFDIADSPGTVADIRGLNAVWVGRPTIAVRLVGRREGR